MDATGFEYWLNIRYTEFRKISEGPWCLLVEKCDGHGGIIAYNRLKVVSLFRRKALPSIKLSIFCSVYYGETPGN